MEQVQDLTSVRPIGRRTDAAEVAIAAYEQLDGLLRTLNEQDWSAPTPCPGWTVADMVGHLIGAARGNATVPEFTRQQVLGMLRRRRFGNNPLDATNALQIADQASLPNDRRAEVLRTLAPAAVRGRLRLSRLVGFARVPLSSGGSAGSGLPRTINLGRLLDVVYTRDVWMHTLDIAEATARPLSLAAPVNARIVQDVAIDWARRHGQPVGLRLTGPAGGTYGAGPSADRVQMELDAADFCRTLSGRAPGEGLLGTQVLF